MKFVTLATLLALSAVPSTLSAPLPLVQQVASALGSGGTSSQTQHNDYSRVSPGNSVQNGGGAAASDVGTAGRVTQSAPQPQGLGFFARRQLRGQTGEAEGHGGTAYTFQDNDTSGVEPGNEVSVGGQQSVDLSGLAGGLLQSN